ncbi:MAG: hypothetical protein Q8L39_14090 [Burkholderiales bacterium]|nr:hypothetical protein [Burkholderiales bacterium]
MRSTQLSLLFILLALQGCAHYLPPLSGPTANLRFVSLPGNKTEINALNDARCDSTPGSTIAVVGEALRNETGQGRSVGIPLSDLSSRTNASEIAIRSGQAFALAPWPSPCSVGSSIPSSSPARNSYLRRGWGSAKQASLAGTNRNTIS